jgi:ADP-heptose:LPS heptosyltransferase
MAPNQSKQALIYHSGALGDFITTIPAIDCWKKQHKDLQLVMLGNPEIGKFATDTGIVHNFLDINQSRHAALFSDKFPQEIPDFLAPFSQIIAFANPDSPLIANFHAFGIPCLSQPPFPLKQTHAVDYHLSLFTDVSNLSEEGKIPRLKIPHNAAAEKATLIPMGTDCIAIHPGSGSAKKNWPFERFLSVARRLCAKGYTIIWIAGPAEQELAFPETDYVFVKQPLMGLASLLCQCGHFIGNDSGVAHLAAALGCRTIALFGPSDPCVWAPRGTNVTVLCKNRPCSPCHPDMLHTCARDRACLLDICVDDVLAAC